VGWTTDRACKNRSKWCIQPLIFLCSFYSACIIYECGPGPHNATWWAAVWRLMTFRLLNYIKLMHFYAQKKNRQCTYKRSIEACSRKSKKYYMFWVRICGLSYTVSNAHVPYYVICGQSGSITFFHVISKRHGFRERNIERKMCVLMSSTIFVWHISHCKKNSASYYHKYSYVFV